MKGVRYVHPQTEWETLLWFAKPGGLSARAFCRQCGDVTRIAPMAAFNSNDQKTQPQRLRYGGLLGPASLVVPVVSPIAAPPPRGCLPSPHAGFANTSSCILLSDQQRSSPAVGAGSRSLGVSSIGHPQNVCLASWARSIHGKNPRRDMWTTLVNV